MTNIKQIDNYKLFAFQHDTVEMCMEIVNRCNGVAILDQTGLGKTVTSATLAINIIPENGKILVISPSTNKSGWTRVLKNVKGIEYVISGNRKFPETDNTDYDVIIVDEAHNFRNNKGKTYRELFLLIRKNKAKVILLSATPFNNTIMELMNTFALIPFTMNCTPSMYLGISCFLAADQFKTAQTIKRFADDNMGYRQITEFVEANSKGMQYVEMIRKIMQSFCVRNTRKKITELYPEDLELMGNFPTVTHNPKIITDNKKSFQDKINKTLEILDALPLCKQNIQSYYVGKEYSVGMAGIYRTFCMKRLDSSVRAFMNTIKNSLSGLKELEKFVGKSTIEVDGESKNIIEKFWSDYKKDVEGFTQILGLWDASDDLEKLENLKAVCKDNRTVIFTEYIDTLHLISDFLNNNGIKHLAYSSESDEKLVEVIAKEFDANLDIKEQTNHYDALVCTDILSEGVNLHRGNKLCHFDSKWNPAKMEQREGRVNRIVIGGKNVAIGVDTFSTDILVEKIIKLEQKIEHKSTIAAALLDLEYQPIIQGIKIDLPSNQRYWSKHKHGNTQDLNFVVKGDYEDFVFTKQAVLRRLVGYSVAPSIEQIKSNQLYAISFDHDKFFPRDVFYTNTIHRVGSQNAYLNHSLPPQIIWNTKTEFLMFNPLYSDTIQSMFYEDKRFNIPKTIEVLDIMTKNIVGSFECFSIHFGDTPIYTNDYDRAKEFIL